METTVLEKDNRRLVYADNRVIGEILDGRFIQRINRRHLLRSLNSKGIEIDVYDRLLHETVHSWRLEFTDTKEILEMPFGMIPRVAILNPPCSAGNQYHVKLQFFRQKQGMLQSRML